MKWLMPLLILNVFTMLTSCGPARVIPFETIETNETAFLVPLEGASKDKQGKFMSLDFLKESKVATKRVMIPVKEYATGRMWFDYRWLRTMRVIKVDRTPETREWTDDATTGTTQNDEAIEVESLDSIGFKLGVNITAMITEEDASLFLYTYAGKSLKSVVDEDVRGKVLSILSREFGSRTLDKCKKEKKTIFDIARKEVGDHFKQYGVTISNLGHSKGLTYKDKEIQNAINQAYVEEMNIQAQGQKNLAQKKINKRNVGMAIAEKDAAVEFAKARVARAAMVGLEIRKLEAKAKIIKAEALKKLSDKWDGHYPEKMMPANANLLYNLDK